MIKEDTMNEIIFNNTYYHLNRDMEQWCRENIGQGSWGGQKDGDMWSIDSLFGTTTFKFIDENDFDRFKLRWEQNERTN